MLPDKCNVRQGRACHSDCQVYIEKELWDEYAKRRAGESTEEEMEEEQEKEVVDQEEEVVKDRHTRWRLTDTIETMCE